ncbi:MAG: hypothetical protein NZQ09_11240 [Chloroflexus sp.]|nr:hypothetical protein [Chloroflexus sp.]
MATKSGFGPIARIPPTLRGGVASDGIASQIYAAGEDCLDRPTKERNHFVGTLS